MNKPLFTFFVSMLFVPMMVSAHTEGGKFSEAEDIIEEQTPCIELTSDQLDHIGDYYMEQIHPGEEHEIMDTLMGGDGSDNLGRMHTIMAERFYCNGDQKGTPAINVTPQNGVGMMGLFGSRKAKANENIPSVVLSQSVDQGFLEQQISVKTLFGWILLIAGGSALLIYAKKK